MAQVYMFPEKKKLPKNIEEDVKKNAREYMEILYTTLLLLGEQGIDQMSNEEVVQLVTEAYLDGLNEAIDLMEES